LSDSTAGRRKPSRPMSPSESLRLLQREAEKQRLLVMKSDFVQAKLLFIVEALKDLVADEGFMTLLRAEGLAAMPRSLEARIAGGAQL
jgi:ParB family transcriptional regulator, chromosome partitioning protein